MEHIMRCKVCRKTWTFKDSGVSNNKLHAASTAISAIGQIAAAFGGKSAR